MPTPRKPRLNCMQCNKITARPGYKYCSNKCQALYRYEVYISKWKAGEVSGLQRLGIVSNHIKRYLRLKYNDCCCLCGWSETNVVTGRVPLVADHIDGNWRNNTEENLRLICPNCDSLSETYAALNKGRGRVDRVVSKRVEEARKILENLPG